MNIEHEQHDAEGRFFIEQDGETLAFLHYARAGDVMKADHTFVSEKLRGQGVARKLLDATVEFARATDRRIEQVISYVVKAFERDPSLEQLRAA